MSDAKLTTVDVLPLGRSAAREIGTVTLKTKSQPPQEVVGKYVVVWRKSRPRLEACDRHLEHRQVTCHSRRKRWMTRPQDR